MGALRAKAKPTQRASTAVRRQTEPSPLPPGPEADPGAMPTTTTTLRSRPPREWVPRTGTGPTSRCRRIAGEGIGSGERPTATAAAKVAHRQAPRKRRTHRRWIVGVATGWWRKRVAVPLQWHRGNLHHLLRNHQYCPPRSRAARGRGRNSRPVTEIPSAGNWPTTTRPRKGRWTDRNESPPPRTYPSRLGPTMMPGGPYWVSRIHRLAGRRGCTQERSHSHAVA